MKKITQVVLSALIALVGTRHVQADVIVHAFDKSWESITQDMAKYKSIGVTHLQISPPQKSHPSNDWWALYQPLDFTVLENRLGNEKQLKKMIDTAHAYGIKVIADFVFNHMANYGHYPKTLQYPFFSANDFHGTLNTKICASDDNNWTMEKGWLGCDLPDLATESPYVRTQAKNYARKLASLGIDGFRFDAAKHIEPEFFSEVLKVMPPQSWSYAEVLDTRMEVINKYSSILPVTDFRLVQTMVQAFAIGGDLRTLRVPEWSGRALPSNIAVTFARNHDTVMNPHFYRSLTFSSDHDAILATTYVLARKHGMPFVFDNDVFHPLVQAAIKFHTLAFKDDKPEYFRSGNEFARNADSPNVLWIERGQDQMAIINKAGFALDIPVAYIPANSLYPGCYLDLYSQVTVEIKMLSSGTKRIERWGNRADMQNGGGMYVPARSAAFLVRIGDAPCSSR